MLTLKQNKTENKKRVWDVIDSNGEVIYTLNLVSSSLANKFSIVRDIIDEMNDGLEVEYNDETIVFSYWFEQLFIEYLKNDLDAQMLFDEAEIIHAFAVEYVKSKNIDWSAYVNLKKVTKTSIVFLEENLEAIAISSACLKLYGIFSSDNKLKPPKNLHNQIFKVLTRDCFRTETSVKIFQLMKARTFSSYPKDRGLWELCKLKSCESPDSYIMTIFNYLMSNLFSTLDIDVNPIPYLNKVVDTSINWLIKAMYSNNITFGEIFSSTEDIYGAPQTQHSLSVYVCNDVIGKAASFGLELVEEQRPGITQFEFDIIQDRIEAIDEIYPYMKLFTLPIISEVLEIPYKHLLTIPPKHAVLISLFMRQLSEDILSDKFPYLINLLQSFPKSRLTGMARGSSIDAGEEKTESRFKNVTVTSTRSSYKLRNLELILNDDNKLFGLECPMLRYKLLSSECGVLSASRKGLVSLFSGKPLPRISSLDLEVEVTKFYNSLYSHKLNPYFEKMRNLADEEYF